VKHFAPILVTLLLLIGVPLLLLNLVTVATALAPAMVLLMLTVLFAMWAALIVKHTTS
jgi:hypothetical protein